mmetsp:Transcript_74153/g.179148  ORF Transcript_74153/g.179148 Transcript_74153/m.179148 type:complete len:276 (+) Transcript_74153:670-1497(+)
MASICFCSFSAALAGSEACSSSESHPHRSATSSGHPSGVEQYDWHHGSLNHVIVGSTGVSVRTTYVLLAQFFFSSGGAATTLPTSVHLQVFDTQDVSSGDAPHALPSLFVCSHQSSHDVEHGSTQARSSPSTFSSVLTQTTLARLRAAAAGTAARRTMPFVTTAVSSSCEGASVMSTMSDLADWSNFSCQGAAPQKFFTAHVESRPPVNLIDLTCLPIFSLLQLPGWPFSQEVPSRVTWWTVFVPHPSVMVKLSAPSCEARYIGRGYPFGSDICG